MLFEGRVCGLHDSIENARNDSKILFEIKTGKPKDQHHNQVKNNLGLDLFTELLWNRKNKKQRGLDLLYQSQVWRPVSSGRPQIGNAPGSFFKEK